MRFFRGRRGLFQLLMVSSLIVVGAAAIAACGDDDDGGNGEQLKIGAIVAETGALGPLGVPVIEGIKLAEADINAQGGNVLVTFADSATSGDTGLEAANRLLGEGNKLIIGAMASGVTQAIIQTLSDEKIAQCSPSATSPAFTTQENAGYFIRTAPPDEGVAPLIADEVVASGGTRVAIVARSDDYGNALAALVEAGLDGLGAEHQTFLYDPEAATFDAEITSVVDYGPDAVVNIGFFFDGTRIIRGLIEAGLGPEIQVGGDGLFLPELPLGVDPDNPNVLDGMKVFAASGTDEFNARLTEKVGGNLVYGGQAYDCTVFLALAARAAGNTDGDDIIEAIADLASGGEVCNTYGECAELIDDDKDAHYIGAAGDIGLNDVGDPTLVTYAILQWQDGDLVKVGSTFVDLTELE